MLTKKEEEENKLSDRLMNILKSTENKSDGNQESNTINNNSIQPNDINPYTGFSNRLTSIMASAQGLDDFKKGIEETNQTLQGYQNLVNSIEEDKMKRIAQNSNQENTDNNQENQIANVSANERKNQIKSKEEIDKQIENAKNQSVSVPNANNKIIDNDIAIGLANEKETQNAQELSMSDIKAMQEANKKNKNLEKGGVEAFNEWTNTVLDNIYGGAKQSVAGLANVVTTLTALGIKGLEGASRIVGLEEQADGLKDARHDVVDFGSNISEQANYERTINSRVENDFVKTSGDVSNVISNMLTNTAIGYVTGVSGTVAQGLSVGGSSAQEVLDENKDNVEQATLTGIAKGYVSYLTEKMFDANILTRGTRKTSIQEGINRLISNRINSKFGKEVANRIVGILGENVEELAEDNAGYLIDKLINDKDLPGFEEWWNNTTETAKTTTLSTMIMGLLGLGGESFNDIEIDMETEYWIDQAQQIIKKEDLAVHFNPSEVKNLNETEPFYITRFTQDGELANIVPTQGKPIYNPKTELNVVPVVVKDSETNLYNVIDGNTGVVLDNTYYATTMEAEGGFNEKANKLTDLQVRDINTKIDKANYLITDKIINTITEAREQLAQDNITSKAKTNYTQEQLNDVTKLINQIQDKTIYNKSNANNIFRTVAGNVNNISIVSEDGTNYIKAYDSNGNETYQEKLSSKVFTGSKIKEIVNNAIQYADTSFDIESTNTNIAQTSSNQNANNLQSQETSYTPQDIQKITELFNSQEDYTKNEMAKVWNNEIAQNEYDVSYDENGNIQNYIAIEEDGDNLIVSLYDNEDNIIKSEPILSDKGKYSSNDITSAIEKVSNIYGQNRLMKKASTDKDNKVRNLKESKTPYPKQKQFNEIISNAINDKTAKRSMSIAKVSPRVANRIEKITGINTLNRQERISTSDIRHILNQHGNKNIEATKGQLAVTKSDIKKIPDVIENFDRIVKGSIHKDRNGEHQTIRFIKKYNNNTLYVVEVVPNKGKTLTIKTMWKKPIGLNHGNNTLHHTSKTKANVRKIHIH